MKVLVLGASGATGRQVVLQLMKRKISTRVLVRKSASLPQEVLDHSSVETVTGSISEMDYSRVKELLDGCEVVISCLGHNISFKGLFGKPRSLVVNAVRSVCDVLKKENTRKTRLILMSTVAYTNRSIGEKNTFGEKIVFSLLTWLLPPHRDNMKAANYLIKSIGEEDEHTEWIAVRPDSLINDEKESAYRISPVKTRSPVFNAGQSSRINVGHFMAELVTDAVLWKKWLYQTPALYNEESD